MFNQQPGAHGQGRKIPRRRLDPARRPIVVEHSRFKLADSAEFALLFFQGAQHRACRVQQAFAGRRPVNAAGMAVQQQGAQGGLQIAQALADSGDRIKLLQIK